jgi:1-acyl-sn-glycerol-3-phosphate acyltransferase
LLRDALRWIACGASAALRLGPACAIGPLSPRRGRELLRGWSLRECERFGVRVTVEDRNGGAYGSPPYVFVQLNQTSLAETFILPGRMPADYRILMNLAYALVPLVGWCYALTGSVIVVQPLPRLARRAIDRAIELLGRGESFVISIEGARSPDGTLQPYKKGPAVLAIAGGATIVPFFLRGARERMPVGAWRVTPGHVEVVFCEPIPTRGLTYDDRDSLVEELRGIAEREGLLA